jgi:hypothetical protein
MVFVINYCVMAEDVRILNFITDEGKMKIALTTTQMIGSLCCLFQQDEFTCMICLVEVKLAKNPGMATDWTEP